ncbi:glycosyltransferase [Aestuariimicrobium sp. p3-SID1156]|uniref:glycosyltransferase family protein n=1 Tax=Aestuariimicrobium sp. p3-SID1156 TaxID=2916038 RepID=UPI00223B2796|nr:glycosyltransferase [Aestuariimicrobium sp. p3-SID1156]MCT1458281.1 glycosyltransferase [Aestuariimicrobium sp. p3-SID1156]
MACWLADELRAASREKRRAVVRKYRGVDLTLVWSANQLDILHDCGFPREKIESIPFGFAPGLFPPRSDFSVHGPLVAVGSDRGRDYPTLLAAMQGSGLELDLICKESNLEGATVPSGVNFRGTIPYGDYRAALANAAVVAVPTKVMAYPTGQTVALEAAGSGACVVVTDTPAMREYFSDETAVMVPPHDPAAWRAALVELSRNDTMRARIASAGSQHVHSRFTYLQMWRHVVELWRERSWI